MAISATERIAAPAAPSHRWIGGKLRVFLVVVILVVAAVAVFLPLQAEEWASDTAAATAQLTAAVPSSLPAVSFAALDGLPSPVQRYLPKLFQHIVNGDIDPSVVITHQAPLDEGPELYKTFRDKKDGCIKVVLRP